jgi:hypothetical protein
MEKTLYIRALRALTILMAGFILTAAARSSLATTEAYEAIPRPDFESYREVERAIKPNPFTQLPNAYILIAAFEQQSPSYASEEAKVKGQNHEQEISLYVLIGILLIEEQEAGIAFDSSLIVDVTETVSNSKIIRRWMLSDDDNDGSLDKAVFNEVVKGPKGETLASTDREIPPDRLEKLQGFFDEAIEALSRILDEEPEGERIDV